MLKADAAKAEQEDSDNWPEWLESKASMWTVRTGLIAAEEFGMGMSTTVDEAQVCASSALTVPF